MFDYVSKEDQYLLPLKTTIKIIHVVVYNTPLQQLEVFLATLDDHYDHSLQSI